MTKNLRVKYISKKFHKLTKCRFEGVRSLKNVSTLFIMVTVKSDNGGCVYQEFIRNG